MMEKKEKLELVIEQLEERIAPGPPHGGGSLANNGGGNGGTDGIPGGSQVNHPLDNGGGTLDVDR